MGDIKHRNIVTLHGYYTDPRDNYLIYEFMPNGSLDVVLHGKDNIIKSSYVAAELLAFNMSYESI